MKWFSIKGIAEEIKKIRWPKKDEMVKDTMTALVFMALFAGFFALCDLVVVMIMKVIGIGG
ncbi:MAG: preprotein translocase subunit SecE [Erysipelotrichaceae bacterium]|jgi:preprotein translocase SecE subunit|nr:preprotein translocase subunit SecE [Erysipelotrichaceae bacterium]